MRPEHPNSWTGLANKSKIRGWGLGCELDPLSIDLNGTDPRVHRLRSSDGSRLWFPDEHGGVLKLAGHDGEAAVPEHPAHLPQQIPGFGDWCFYGVHNLTFVGPVFCNGMAV